MRSRLGRQVCPSVADVSRHEETVGLGAGVPLRNRKHNRDFVRRAVFGRVKRLEPEPVLTALADILDVSVLALQQGQLGFNPVAGDISALPFKALAIGHTRLQHDDLSRREGPLVLVRIDFDDTFGKVPPAEFGNLLGGDRLFRPRDQVAFDAQIKDTVCIERLETLVRQAGNVIVAQEQVRLVFLLQPHPEVFGLNPGQFLQDEPGNLFLAPFEALTVKQEPVGAVILENEKLRDSPFPQVDIRRGFS